MATRAMASIVPPAPASFEQVHGAGMGDGNQHPMIAGLRAQLAAGRLARRDFLRLATLLGMSAGAAAAMAGITATPLALAKQRGRGGRLVFGAEVQPLNDPHALAWLAPANVVHQVCEPLTRTGFDNITRPHLLRAWRAAPDLKTWDLHLREDVTWRNGRRFVADDVVWNLRRLLDPTTGSSALGLMRGYMLADKMQSGEQGNVVVPRLWDAGAIEKVDDFHVRLNLKSPQIAVPEHLFHYTNVMMDPEEGGRFGVGANGTGPFDLADYRVGERALLRARNDAGVSGRQPLLDELLLLDLGIEGSAAAGALVSGQVDGLVRCDYAVAEGLAGHAGLQVHRTRTAATALLQMKLDRQPFDDPRVRRALRLAVDVEAVTRLALHGFGEPAEHHLVAPVHPCYVSLAPMGYNPEEARRLLTEAGYPEGLDLTITCKSWPQWELHAVEAMVEQYAAAGIRCGIELLPPAHFWEVWDKVPLAFVEWAPRPLGFMLLDLTMRSGVPWNATGFADPELDGLLDRVEAEVEVAARRPLMARIEAIMQERGPVVQPAWLSVVTVMSRRVGGFRLHPSTLLFAEDYFLMS
jgi:peptide/nickel transport system substrate-binding protein